MKRYIIITLSLLMFAFTATAWAETVTINGDNSGGRDLVFTTSPSTTMDTATTPTAFYITAASTKTTTANGMDYAMTSANGNLYQATQQADNTVEDAGTPGDVPGSPYVMRGGS